MKNTSIRYCLKIFSSKINKLSTTDNHRFDNESSKVLCTGYLNRDISFSDNLYFEPKNIEYKKLVNGVIDQFKILSIDIDCNEISSNFKIPIVLHIFNFF